ncbi:hypothetical protein Nepgr_019790 [Nepenthes gracilis]|uniref:Oxysterol-binding protein n=1 Tax=Nepenthes gracilis TaxID=150966 RepID=A0AAD3SVU0_NEPGR|nr:hypothetical protein Nepgr_019790 [Nepenthes gracilis]
MENLERKSLSIAKPSTSALVRLCPIILQKMDVEKKDNDNSNEDIILSTPFLLEWESNVDHKAPNILQRIISLFKNARLGSDLTTFQLPTHFNIPKSQLQFYGESVYGVNRDMLIECAKDNSPLERMTRVVAWSISTVRPLPFGAVPFNPILGETHHVSRGVLNVFLEQVSHHPPVCALHATDENGKVEVIWCQHYLPKFHGATVETEVFSKRRVKLIEKGENYVMNSPNVLVRLFPVPSIDWIGNVKIKCEESGLEAELCYRGNTLFSLGGSKRSIRGKIFRSSSSTILYEVSGRWDRTVTIKDVRSGKVKVIYDANEVICGLHAPTVKNAEGVRQSESARVWAKVSKGIISRDWEKAREAKDAVEEEQRELARLRKSMAENWSPQHFSVSYSKVDGWDCSPKEKEVPPAPIVYTI